METSSPLPSQSKRRGAFHTLTVSAVRQLTPDAIEVAFAVPAELAHAYDYQPGQYIALRTTLGDDVLRRSYSICQAPDAGELPGELKVAIKRDLGGVFSGWALESLAPGMTLEVMSPEGRFTSRAQAGEPVHCAAIAAGSGITPVLAVVQSVLALDDRNTFSLVYSNRTAMDTMFVDELADLKDRYPSRLALYHVLTRERRSSELLSGRLDEEKVAQILGALVPVESVDEWFLCGPFELVQLCRDALGARGVPGESIRYELFTTGEQGNPAPQRGRPIVVDPGEAVRTIAFRLDGTTSTVTSAVHSQETILNAALRVRGDVPFACAGGVCGTCRAVLREGTVDMVENYALEQEELDRGYVLTCQSIPTSDRVEVDYDT
ncbi:1,2-phenylacetyl-CoA epoxidase subunit PaaE [Humibacter ginsenosidimutans]|uniref:Phenylacetate-CoA oxygenase/reductase subunit PaaK n=1 Tax=Humibacter ginsenosidimutans TaxID=2599293 RepID=A0A5B8M5N8_9MICO|nr:1,2-phenylacetyl-CoA epoxidase subunit PaaE [Humibacter ginsenosidimutans]QDZ14912.1 phenylacetate-CoA oxygenase/reductase subunit PaaK [Humibacter ginsenosidimutans]